MGPHSTTSTALVQYNLNAYIVLETDPIRTYAMYQKMQYYVQP